MNIAIAFIIGFLVRHIIGFFDNLKEDVSENIS
jgi:hypothetical protein